MRIEQMPAARASCCSSLIDWMGLPTLRSRPEKGSVAASDMMDRRLLEIARETDPRYERIVPRGSEAMLLIEQQGEDTSEVRSRLMALVNRIIRRAPTTISSRITTEFFGTGLLLEAVSPSGSAALSIEGNQSTPFRLSMIWLFLRKSFPSFLCRCRTSSRTIESHGDFNLSCFTRPGPYSTFSGFECP